MTDVNCMTCLVNLARGLDDDYDTSVMIDRIKHKGVSHAAMYEMGPGIIRAACRYEPVRGSRRILRWRVRRGAGL